MSPDGSVDGSAWLRSPTPAQERSRAWGERLFGEPDDETTEPEDDGDTAA